MEKKDNLISIIIRTMPGREKFLDKCLFILTGQVYQFIEPIIVVQKLKEGDSLENIQSIVSRWKNYFTNIQLLSHTSAQDARSRSLNMGMEAATGQYLAFLDDDDKVYPEHYSNIIERLQKSKHAWAYADIILATYNIDGQLVSRETPFKRERYSFLNHIKGNFIPIHSFVIDQFKVENIGSIDETMDKNEDYEFLLRLAFKYEPLYVEKFGAEYSVRSDGTNTIMSAGSSPIELYEKRQKWIEAELKLNHRKVTNFGWWVREISEQTATHNKCLEQINYELLKESKRRLKNIYRSVCWKFIRLFRKINWKLRQRPKKKDIIPETNAEAAMLLLEIYSSKSWQIICPIYAIESILRQFK
ncbi:glycosyltransferase family 2 protein [Snodgrassella communis]|uniref:glycosyltransferase family 2 protein n=1 Tax=Snodgrassella communis TaxID=2946699 RepID=UPI001EF4868A|nr:glycosyltransferase [Snodgrassella communis]